MTRVRIPPGSLFVTLIYRTTTSGGHGPVHNTSVGEEAFARELDERFLRWVGGHVGRTLSPVEFAEGILGKVYRFYQSLRLKNITRILDASLKVRMQALRQLAESA